MAAIKTEQDILHKLGIAKLNPMQKEAHHAIQENDSVVLLSPTGTGKTLAFLLPIIKQLNPDESEIQAIIVAPTRELAMQIEQVARNMGSGYKTNVVYGGRAGSVDKVEIRHRPAILIGTPGRIADHLRRENFETEEIKILVLDEFDKSLEIGFEDDMIDILDSLPNIEKKILTSATAELKIPGFVGLNKAKRISFLHEKISQLKLKSIVSPEKDKLATLVNSLRHIGNKPGIIFCNYKDTIQRISDYLTKNQINHGCFYGGMEQRDRERALIKFRNGTHQIIIATDLAARGIDIPEIKFIIHYQLPHREQEFTHRNGRTARMNKSGTAYILKWKNDEMPEYLPELEEEKLSKSSVSSQENWTTLFISGGKKDKISKGDIAGMFIKQAGLHPDQVGTIEIKVDCSFVGVKSSQVKSAISKTNNTRLKKKKIRVSVA
ncbi:MAG: DEAD/DEAH box helicase [Bacteroidia bacterium]|nr:DEAD/DEAH box helicase [Bacteroidia bacterium]NNJ55873.1 DEAD/DEAH box helicase [Bacteroidia bacterium]